ncbi:phage tail sheath subtilisin-like domain-containing protein [Cohnella abietis]|uniref:Phage portal protein n=1 Tax=Cohnella abietis TaxID=2507935 RepID=A0A3T1D2Z8_9BACL|nr:phage tail sheath subtilisin-like domain-containing protein [Cohnella abietis]BBI32486.1 phage portal protein [Cohnella abietis]
MGLPEISISFTSLAVSAIQRSQRGIVALILQDNTGNFDSKEYKAITEVETTEWTPANLDLIQKTFLGVPSKIIVERIAIGSGETPADYAEALNRLAGKRWNYLAAPKATTTDVTKIATQIKTWRDANKKTFKAVLPNSANDHEGIINFTTGGIVVGETIYTASDYTARIAGILASLPLTRSSTYYVLPEVETITESVDPKADIDAGKLILINDGEKIKIGRGVNSLTTLSEGKTADFTKIKIIEGHDLVQDDISRTFSDNYVGKVNNSYDNQALFITAVNSYLRRLEGDVLDPAADNRATVDIEAQRLAWEDIGEDTTSWNDQKVKETTFQAKVFLGGALKFLDAVEDLQLKIAV